MGEPQRHRGLWGEGYGNTGGIIVQRPFTRLDGLAVRSLGGLPIYEVQLLDGAGEVWISRCYGELAGGSSFRVFQVAGTEAATVKIWNTIGMTSSTLASTFVRRCPPRSTVKRPAPVV